MFYIVGLGLCDEKDITVRGLEVCLNSPVWDMADRICPGSKRLHASVFRSLHLNSDGTEGKTGARYLNPDVNGTLTYVMQGSLLWQGSDSCGS